MHGPELIHILMNPILASLMGSLLLLIWFYSRQQTAIKYFGIAYLSYALCNFQLILVFPSYVPLNVLSTGIFHALFASFFYAGVVTLGYKQPKWAIIAALAAVFLIARLYFGIMLEDRALRVYTVFSYYSAVLLLGAWQVRELRRESPLAAILFYLVLTFALASLPQALLSDFNTNTQYGFTPTEHWYTKHFAFNIFFIVFYSVLLAVIAWRGIREAKIEGATDPLTELFNRRGFESELEKQLEITDSYSLISLDLDNFKSVNDTYGHDVGDEALRMVAQRIVTSIRDEDIAVRMGGEEFLVFLPNTELNEATIFAERLREAISKEPIKVLGSSVETICVTSSFGVCHFNNDAHDNTLAQAYRFVDGLLYQAKKNGRNQVMAKQG